MGDLNRRSPALRQGFVLSMMGIVLGVFGSIAVGRPLTAGLMDLGQPIRSASVLVPLVSMGLTMAASYVPARRGSLDEPLVAVRHEEITR